MIIKRHIRKIIFSVLTLIVMSVFSQTRVSSLVYGKTVVTESFLLKNIDPISSSLGNLKLTTPASVSSIYSNPSQIIFKDNMVYGINANYVPYTNSALKENIYTLSLGGFYRTNLENLFAGSVRFLNFGDINLVSESFEAFGSMHPFTIVSDVSYARRLKRNLSVSMTIHYLYSNYTDGKAVFTSNIDIIPTHSFATDLLLSYKKEINKNGDEIKIAGGFKNLGATLGSRYTYRFQTFLPASLGIGMSYKKKFNADAELEIFGELNKLLVPILYYDTTKSAITADYSSSSILPSYFISLADNKDGLAGELGEIALSLGAEFIYDERLSFRLGYFKDAKTLTNTNTASAGVGLKFSDHYQIDLSFNTYVFSDPILSTSPNNNMVRFGFTYNMFSSVFDAEKARIKGFLYR